MRRITCSTYVTLDGVIDAPQDWPALPDDGGDAGRIQTELLLGCDALLMGRRTYEGFAAVWPGRSGDPYSDHINGMDKYVVSSTVTDPAWSGTRVIDGGEDLGPALSRLKEADGGGIVQYGVGPLTAALLAHGLLDELRLWVHPFLLGVSGPDVSILQPRTAAAFTLADTMPLASGIVVLTYTAAPAG